MFEGQNARMRVLITGAGGFIGQALAAALVREGETSVVLTDVVEPTSPDSRIRCIQADLTSQDVCDSLLTKELTHVFLLHGIMSGAAGVLLLPRVDIQG